MLWCQGAQNTGLSNHKLKSAQTCTVRSQCTSVPDRQTNRQTERQRERDNRTDRRTSWQYRDSSF